VNDLKRSIGFLNNLSHESKKERTGWRKDAGYKAVCN